MGHEQSPSKSSDITIKVENKLFVVNRCELSESSDFFKRLLTSGWKEDKEGVINLRGVEENGAEQCLKHIQTGKVELNEDNILQTLSASHHMLLDNLLQVCWHWLEEHDSTKLCVATLLACNLYEREKTKEKILTFASEHFDEVTDTPEFIQISFDDLRRCLWKIPYDFPRSHIQWDGIAKWILEDIESREAHFSNLLDEISFEEFSSEFFFKSVMNQDFVSKSEQNRFLLARKWFTFSSKQITTDNFYSLVSQAARLNLLKCHEVKDVLATFLEKELMQLSKKEEFVEIDRELIIALYECGKTRFFPERVKWEGAVKWVKHDDKRKSDFHNLFKCIDLRFMRPDFIQEFVHSEALVTENDECQAILQNFLAIQDGKTRLSIACTYKNRSDVKAFDLKTTRWKYISEIRDSNVSHIFTISVLEGRLFVIKGTSLFMLNRSDNWIELAGGPIHYSDHTTTCNNCLYVINDKNMACYDPFGNSWSESTNESGCNRGFCITASENSLYVIGCRWSENRAFKYDPSKGEWSILPKPKKDCREVAAAVMNKKLFVLGGCFALRCESANSTVEFLNLETGEWTEISGMIYARKEFSTCVIGSQLYAIGGAKLDDVENDSIEVYDESADKWRVVTYIRGNKKGGRLYCCQYALDYLFKTTQKRQIANTGHCKGNKSRKQVGGQLSSSQS